MSDLDGYSGTQDATSATDEYGATSFIIRAILAGLHHVDIVRVVAVTNTGGLALAGTVDVQPLVNQLDASGNAVAHGVANELPYARMQGGTSGIIMDPTVGDIGLCLFADRDISSVVATSDTANPGSMRRCSMSDGVYLGGLLNGIPTQYVMFDATGISIVSPTKITMQAPEIDLVAPVIALNASTSTTVTTPTFTVNGASQFNGAVSATGVVHTDASVTASADVHAAGTVTGDSEVVVSGHGLKLHIHTGGTIAGKTGPIV